MSLTQACVWRMLFILVQERQRRLNERGSDVPFGSRRVGKAA